MATTSDEMWERLWTLKQGDIEGALAFVYDAIEAGVYTRRMEAMLFRYKVESVDVWDAIREMQAAAA